MCAISTGTPACRSAQARIVGPSLSRNTRLSSVSARKNASDDSFSTPTVTPCSSAWPIEPVALCASDVAELALFGSIPRSFSQPWTVVSAEEMCLLMLADSLEMPPTITTTTSAPTRTSASSSSTAPSARGTPWPLSHATTGDATAAMTPAAISGMTIVWVSASSQTSAHEQQRDADEQPRREAQVAEPPGRRADHLMRGALVLWRASSGVRVLRASPPSQASVATFPALPRNVVIPFG